MKSDKIQQEADLLLEHYFSGMLTQDMEKIIQGWMVDDEGRAVKDASIAKMFFRRIRPNSHLDPYTRDSLEVLHYELNFNDYRTRELLPVAESAMALPRRRRRSILHIVSVAVAAAGVFFGVLSSSYKFYTNSLHPTAQMAASTQFVERSQAGAVRELALPDGTMVRLKGKSTLIYADNFAANRRVKLDGEAFFSVMRDELHPFSVEGNQVTVTVLGTEFNARMVSLDTLSEVSVSSGRVQVASGTSSVTLEKSQKATVDHQRGRIVTSLAGRGELLRQSGRGLVFEDIALREALGTIGEYFEVEMRLAEDLPEADGLTLNLGEDATLEVALELLRAIDPIFHYSIEEDVVVVTMKR